MNFGILIPPVADSWKVVKRAEELGFTRAWFYDTQLLNAEIFVAMGAAAMKTSRIRLEPVCWSLRTASRRSPPVLSCRSMRLHRGVSTSVSPPASPPGAPWGLVRSGSPTCGATSSRCSG